MFTVIPEFRNIKVYSVVNDSSLPYTLLYILFFVLLIINIFQFFRNKYYPTFIPSLICLVLIVIILVHKQIRRNIDNLPIVFSAVNYNIGNDGGFTLYFKEGNHLTGHKIDHFADTYYWGKYQKKGDTLLFDISLDFKMSKKAFIRNDTIVLINDTRKFIIYHD